MPTTSPSAIDCGRTSAHLQVLKSLKQKALTESDLASLEELARKCLARRDYEQVIQIIERIPEEQRNAGLVALWKRPATKPTKSRS